MPYLTEKEKKLLDCKAKMPTTPGELTYLLTTELIKVTNPELPQSISNYDQYIGQYLYEREPSFARYAEVLGAIQATILEYRRRRWPIHDWQVNELRKLERVMDSFYTRSVGPYEDGKIKVNGDVYE